MSKTKTVELVAEVGPTSVRFVAVDVPDGEEAQLVGMHVLSVAEWRKLGAPLKLIAELTPVPDEA